MLKKKKNCHQTANGGATVPTWSDPICSLPEKNSTMDSFKLRHGRTSYLHKLNPWWIYQLCQQPGPTEHQHSNAKKPSILSSSCIFFLVTLFQ